MPLPRFDTRAKNALATAQQIAIQLGHNYIGSEHLLFGILNQPQEGLPFQMSFIDNLSSGDLLEILRRVGFEKMQQNQQKNGKNEQSVLPEITEELQLCLDTAIKVADKNQYNYVGVEHLIYGILETKDSNGKNLMNLNDENGQKLKDILDSLFQNYNKKEDKNKQKFASSRVKKDSALEFFTTNLNQKVEKEPDWQILGREREVERILQILTRKHKNNPMILGEPGVGKTALVEGLARRINQGLVPSWLKNKKIMSLDLAGLLAGTIFRGEFEQRLKAMLDEIMENKDIILFIDEIHMAIGAGSGMGNGPELSGMLKPVLTRGDVSVIGATTEDEYRSIIKKDRAFERRFQVIRLEEPDQSQVYEILKGSKTVYENFHQCAFPEELLPRLIDLASRFVPERFFPDKAIDILDETLVRARILFNQKTQENVSNEQKWVEVEHQILDLIKQKNEAILNQNFALSEQFEQEQKKLEQTLSNLNQQNQQKLQNVSVNLEILEKVVSEVSGVPLVRISSSIYTQIRNLEEALSSQIFGQKEAITQVCRSLKRSYTGVNPHKGPISSFLLLGPTGVGKTELVKVLTQELYGDLDKFLLKIDMSEFREKHNMSRLLGAPAGYVGYEDAPQLTEWLRKKPYSVILFDEIEKGHPESLNILLQMLEDGKITDAKGQQISCQHALIFATSNLGKSQLNKFAAKIGFASSWQDQEEADYENIKKQVIEEVEKAIKPEILGRLTGGKIVFRPIGHSTLRQIFVKELGEIQKHLLKQGRKLSFAEEVVEFLLNQSTDKFDYGAREVKSMVADLIQDPIAEFLLENPENKTISVLVETLTEEEKQSKKILIQSGSFLEKVELEKTETKTEAKAEIKKAKKAKNSSKPSQP